MRKICLASASFFVMLLVFSCSRKPFLDEHGCYLDKDEAVSAAQKRGRDILAVITAEGEDYTSSSFIENVVSSDLFKEQVLNNYIVYRYDVSEQSFSRTVVKETDTKKEQRQAERYAQLMQDGYQFAALLGIAYTPSVFRLTKEGYVVSELEYESEILDAEKFVSLLHSYDSRSSLVNALVENTRKGSSLERAAAIDTLYQATPEAYRGLLEDLAATVPELDPDNESGMTGRYIVIAAQKEAIQRYREGDLSGAVQVFLQASENPYVGKSDRQNCYYTAAYFLSNAPAPDIPLILSYLSKAYEVDKESELAPLVLQTLDYFNNINSASQTE